MSYSFGEDKIVVGVVKENLTVSIDYKNDKLVSGIDIQIIVQNGGVDVSEGIMNRISEFVNTLNEELNE